MFQFASIYKQMVYYVLFVQKPVIFPDDKACLQLYVVKQLVDEHICE